MQIRHDPRADSVAHEDTTYTADEDGIFDVPESVGLELVGRHGWSIYTGEPEEPDDVVSLRARVAELEAELAKAAASKSKAKVEA